MEIITNVHYEETRHSTKAFTSKYIKPIIFPVIRHQIVRDAMHNRDMIQALEVIMSYDWVHSNLRVGGIAGQSSYIKLAGDIVVNVYVIVNYAGDRLCIMDAVNSKVKRNLIIAYVGDADIFNKYMRELGVSEVEIYSDIRHLVEDE